MSRMLFLCGEPGAHTAVTGGGDFSGLLIGFGIFELAAVVLAGIAVGTILLLVRLSDRSGNRALG
jgi:hypothetical protein